ncbi:hypothetical protein B0A52_05936 [Exophiala mesophila]|uniref:Xylanolytic transcriptional activator regulatory domain-containing protein n=1 Tax=Exophiala mesophila TaxID=212818 RepID=A0A438N4H0_EXOME|nr:hypothetical protein B0A52_05936 [Exophiala mesophila]
MHDVPESEDSSGATAIYQSVEHVYVLGSNASIHMKPRSASMPPTKRYVEALHARIESLERQLQAYQRQRLDSAASGAAYPPTKQDTDSTDLNLDVDVDDLPHQDRGPVDDLAEIAGQLDIAEDGHLRYFGAPSYFNLLRRNAYGSTSNVEQDPYGAGLAVSYDLFDINLPLETQTHLLDLYWKWQNPWQYLVHRTACQRAVDRGTYDDYCTPLLMRCILALAARYCDHSDARLDPHDANTAGDLLAAQAKDILSVEIEHPSTSTAAALALLALREMSVNKESLGWIYIGMAVRIAYNLGLNLDCQTWVNQQKISEEEAEIRRITWLFTLGLGRPSMIRERDITAAKPSLLKEEEFVPWLSDDLELSADMSASRCVSNLRYMTSIFQTACPTLDEIYSPKSELSLQAKEEMTAKAYLELTEIYSKLPGFLKFPHSAKTPRPAHIYSLHLQYHTVLILLHRPFLRQRERRASNQTSSSFSHNQICTSSAEAISNILRAYRANFTLRRIPISTIHALGTASVILLLDATSSDTKTSRAAIRLLKFNLTCLQEMSVAWNWSLRAIRSLQILAEEWSVNERLHAQNDHKALGGESSSELTAVTASNMSFNPDQNVLGSEDVFANMSPPAMYETSPENIDWLMAFDSGFSDVPMDLSFIDQDLWEMGAR